MAQQRRAEARAREARKKKALKIAGIAIVAAVVLSIFGAVFVSAVKNAKQALAENAEATETTETTISAADKDAADSASDSSSGPVLDTETGLVAENGDTVNIAFTGYLDGEAFDGGSSDSYDLELGSGTFIDGFEEGVMGHAIGDTFDLNLTFPDNYGNSDLAGKDVVFTVTLNGIYE